jgi:hypothetical protein
MTEQAEKMGVKELSEVLIFAIGLGEAVDLSLADKKIDLADLGLLVGPFTKAPAAIEGFDKVVDEIKDLDAAEMDEVKALVKDELNLSDDKLEEKIEAGVDFLGALHTFILKLRA